MHTLIPVFFTDLLVFAHCQYTRSKTKLTYQMDLGSSATSIKNQPSDVAPPRQTCCPPTLHPLSVRHSKVSRTCSPLSQKPQIVLFMPTISWTKLIYIVPLCLLLIHTRADSKRPHKHQCLCKNYTTSFRSTLPPFPLFGLVRKSLDVQQYP